MIKEKYIEDIKEIKDIMDRSSRFISLSGLSGVSTGIIALSGAWLAYEAVFKDHHFLVYDSVKLGTDMLNHLLLIVTGTLTLAICSALFFTNQQTKKHRQRTWDVQTQRVLINLLIPLATGGLMCLMLLLKGFVGMLPSLTLIFYGLALVNASKYTFTELRTLGLIEVVLGLLAFQFIELSLIFWAAGFGVVQIIYGLIIQAKHKG